SSQTSTPHPHPHSFPTRRSSDLVIVPLKAGAPLWVGRGMDAQSAILTTTLPHEHVRVAEDVLVRERGGQNRTLHEHVLSYADDRSEEHTSELQSRENLVCRLLLE